VKHLPNLLTALRLGLSLFVFFALLFAGRGREPNLDVPLALARWAFAAFVVAAVTDFFDGWLARRFDVVSVAGAILDPIADKVLICAAILGLMTIDTTLAFVIPAALILFREFSVSALREVTAARGVKLPVTLLAKWKTTFQLVALGADMVVTTWPAFFGLPTSRAVFHEAAFGAHALFWLACAVTLITGAQYGVQAYRGLSSIPSPARGAG
jgi:CDP-diacylglycerol--glycerol-3-phosphate 3-phosphatidyltransferase